MRRLLHLLSAAIWAASLACDSGARSREHDGGARDGGAHERGDADVPFASYLTRAGDGSEALRKLAEVWCERLIPCADEGGTGQWYADHATCVREQADALPDNGLPLGCDYQHDLTIAPEPLARCMQAMAEASCSRLQPGVAPLQDGALYLYAYGGGQLSACREAMRAVSRAQDAAWERVPEGGACEPQTGLRCGELTRCDVPEGATCGRCVSDPAAGEPCLDTNDGCICGPGTTRGSDRICREAPGGEGGSCPCNPGLDCGRDGVCAARHHEGDPCTDEVDCGEWLSCREQRCRYSPPVQLPPAVVRLGVACGGESGHECAIGRCLAGTCVELGNLGDRCDEELHDQCKLPYVCVGGVCREGPACGRGRPGDRCETSWQCEVGSICISEAGGPRAVCRERDRPAINGEEECTERFGCERGRCVEHWCRVVADGEPCTADSECRSRSCVAGSCAASGCR